MSKRVIFYLASSLLLLGVFYGCKISLSMSGVTVSPEVKTAAVFYFPNRSVPLFNPSLSADFQDMLKDKIKDQTPLILQSKNGDVTFEGEITGYSSKPMSVTSNETASTNRLSITIKVKFVNVVEPDSDFSSAFTQFEDYDSSQRLDEVEEELVPLILEKITDDIIQKAFVNW